MGTVKIGQHISNFTAPVIKATHADGCIKLALTNSLIINVIIQCNLTALTEMKTRPIQHFGLNKTACSRDNHITLKKGIPPR